MSILYNFLGPDDRPAIIEHLLGLDRDDRVLRFSNPAPDGVIRDYCARWHFDRDLVVGAWDGGRLIGMIHLPVYDERSGAVGELGVSVAADCRKRGLAKQLAARTLLEAHRRGLVRVYIHFLTRNRPMNHLARRFTDDIVMDEDESHATIDLAGDAVRRAAAMVRTAEPGTTLELLRLPERPPEPTGSAAAADRDQRRRPEPTVEGPARSKAA